MNIQTDRALIPAGSVSERYLTVTITAPTRERKTERPSVNVALVLDRSGSMGARKIEMARTAVEHAIKLLNERDRLALVCYDTEIDTLLATTPATPEAKAMPLARLRASDARGSTDLCGGWMRGAGQLESHAGPDAISRVLLLSDGLANHGETNQDTLAARSAELRAKGIATSTFGLGADFDERLMSRLATDGGGNFYFIEQPAQIGDFFTSELGETLDIVARDARLIVGGSDDIQVRCLNDFPGGNRRAAAGADHEAHIRLGDLASGQQVTLVIAVRCPALPLGNRAEIALRLSDREGALFQHPLVVDWRAASAQEDAAQPINGAVLVEAGRQLASLARLDALDANRAHNFAAAQSVLEQAAKAIRALAPGLRELEALAAELESERVDHVALIAPMLAKEQYFQSYAQTKSRDVAGKARRRST